MKTKIAIKKKTFLWSCVFFIGLNSSLAGEIFPVPDILKDNIAFWKMIYTRVGIGEGVLHDRHYPSVIFEKVEVGHLPQSAKKVLIKEKKAEISERLRRIAVVPFDSLSLNEIKILEMYAELDAGAMDSAAFRIRYQGGRKERFMQGISRSAIYLDTIRWILSQHGLPLELAYLPHVESSFDEDARSRVGALGMWQFMPGTGRAYMRVDKYIDERRDPVRSTAAAAKLLAENYGQLNSWPLAITAYNYGASGLIRAVSELGSNDIAVLIDKHQSRSFKFASKNFYSCFLAALEIAQQHWEYFPNIRLKKKPKTTVVELPFSMPASVISHYVNLDSEILLRLNPAMSPQAFDEDVLVPQGYAITLPAAISSAAVDSAFAALPHLILSHPTQLNI